MRLLVLAAAGPLAATQQHGSPPPHGAEACGDCGGTVQVGVDFLGNDIGEMSKQPDRETCCRFCRSTQKATAWTYSTGSDYPQGCWCKTEASSNPACAAPCPRISGQILPPCLPWGWTFLICLSIGTVAYGFLGVVYNAKVLGKDEFPNADFWLELTSLVRDGVSYTFNTSLSAARDAARPTPRGDYQEVVEEVDPAEAPASASLAEARERFKRKSKPAKPGKRTRLMEAAIIGRRKAVKDLLKERKGMKELDSGDQRGATAYHQ